MADSPLGVDSYMQAVAGTIFSHRSILRKAFLVWDDDADGIVSVPAFRAGLKSVNILLDTPMTPHQVLTHLHTSFWLETKQLSSVFPATVS